MRSSRLLFVTLILFFIISPVFAQDENGASSDLAKSQMNIQRNSFLLGSNFVTLTASYERLLPVRNNFGLLLGGGLNQGVAFTSATNFAAKFGTLIGKPKHFLEVGTWFLVPAHDINMLAPFAGYRYQASKGFLLRIELTVVSEMDDEGGGNQSVDITPVPGLTIGYSF